MLSLLISRQREIGTVILNMVIIKERIDTFLVNVYNLDDISICLFE